MLEMRFVRENIELVKYLKDKYLNQKKDNYKIEYNVNLKKPQ